MKSLLPKIFGMMLLCLLVLAGAGFADIIVDTDPDLDGGRVITRTHYWEGPDTPIGTLFYFVGDVVEFPFNLIGNIF